MVNKRRKTKLENIREKSYRCATKSFRISPLALLFMLIFGTKANEELPELIPVIKKNKKLIVFSFKTHIFFILKNYLGR
jgi:hypothetical protein